MKGADPDIRDVRGHTALTKAGAKRVFYTDVEGNRAMVTLLADLTSKNLPDPEDGVTPMVAAINSANMFALRALRDAGYPVALTPPFQHLEPIAAMISGDVERLRKSLGNAYSLEAKTALGRTFLMWAAQLGNLDMIRILFDAGADLEAVGEVFKTPGTALFTAVEGNPLEACRLFLERGAQPIFYGNNALQLALDLNDNSPDRSFRDV